MATDEIQKLTLSGMHCRSCELILADEIGDIDGVSSVTANHMSGELLITHGGNLNQKLVNEAIKECGFQVIQDEV